MIFLPIYHDLKIEQYEWTFADEVQDFNQCQIELLKKTVRKTLVAVGDRNQSCYAFRGAALRAMDDIKEEFEAQELPLSVTFRVPKVGVDYVNSEFDHILFRCLPGAKEGKLGTVSEDKLTAIVRDGDLVICRMNAPLVKHVFTLLSAGRKATIVGRNLASQLSSMVERFCEKKRPSLVDTGTLLEKLEQYRYLEVNKLNNLGREMAAETLSDKVDTVIAISDGCKNAQCILNRIDEIFSKDAGDGVSFSSVHRAKGLEASRVFVLKPDLMPLKSAIGNPTQERQEMNIHYIATTRFKDEMYFVY